MYTQVINITSCQVCPGGCGPPFPSPPIPCPPIPGAPSCMCQHPDGIIDLRPLANVNGTARYKSSWIECCTQRQQIKLHFVCTFMYHSHAGEFLCPQINSPTCIYTNQLIFELPRRLSLVLNFVEVFLYHNDLMNRFSKKDNDGNTYFFNPCQSFHYGKCWNTHVSQLTKLRATS